MDDARRKVLNLVRREVHPEANIVINTESEFVSCGQGVWMVEGGIEDEVEA